MKFRNGARPQSPPSCALALMILCQSLVFLSLLIYLWLLFMYLCLLLMYLNFYFLCIFLYFLCILISTSHVPFSTSIFLHWSLLYHLLICIVRPSNCGKNTIVVFNLATKDYIVLMSDAGRYRRDGRPLSHFF